MLSWHNQKMSLVWNRQLWNGAEYDCMGKKRPISPKKKENIFAWFIITKETLQCTKNCLCFHKILGGCNVNAMSFYFCSLLIDLIILHARNIEINTFKVKDYNLRFLRNKQEIIKSGSLSLDLHLTLDPKKCIKPKRNDYENNN